ncbi:UNVERIFIED_CONTAM: Ethylene-responsive transcription factor [Sesamum radiatum]|uniref:Ethylene-responsive transcription factor n=1 Tax=Sesamum radiatum TaxID=300843 RepID=A0AAW2PX00_SESRA
MSSSSDEIAYANCDSTAASHKKYKGIRRRKWGKWVSEIRVPGTPERLWLGSYATPEAAAVAHDVAFYCLRGNSSRKISIFLRYYPPAPGSGCRRGRCRRQHPTLVWLSTRDC